jgi:hypothetical protein
MTRRRDDSVIDVVMKSPATGLSLRSRLFDPESPPMLMSVQPDANGNGADEIVATGRRESDGLLQILMKESFDSALLGRAFLPADIVPMAQFSVPDFAETLADEFGMLQYRASDGLRRTELRDGDENIPPIDFSYFQRVIFP